MDKSNIISTNEITTLYTKKKNKNNTLDFLKTHNTYITNSKNKKIYLIGVNIEGWLQWQGNIFGLGFIPENRIRSEIKYIGGEKSEQAFEKVVYENFITEKDIKQISGFGFNTIRLPINHTIFDKPEKQKYINNVIDWARKYGVYIILDLHSTPLPQSNLFVADPKPSETLLWESKEAQEQTVQLWKKIAQMYKDESVIAGYDLINEPHPYKDQEMIDLYIKIIHAIRGTGDQHIIFLEGTNFSTNFSAFTYPLDENIVYSFHLYSLVGKDNKDKITKQLVTLAQQQNIPLWLGEFGANDYKWTKEVIELTKNNKKVISGWAYWNWKRVPSRNNERYTELISITPPEETKKIQKWIIWPHWPNKLPTSNEIEKYITTFGEYAKYNKNQVNYSTLNILNSY